MTLEFARKHLRDRAGALGYQKEDYTIRFEHLLLLPRSTMELTVFNAALMLIEETQDVAISSELGIYDLSSDRINKQQYEHQGQVTFTNQTSSIRYIRFLQIIFNISKPCQ
jgi:hypothetical protein